MAVANEWVCARMAVASELRCPRHQLLEVEGRTFFGSMDSGLLTIKDYGPDVTGAVSFIDELARVVTFDLWIMNRDRHMNNILVSSSVPDDPDSPPVPVVFDHDRALFAECANARCLVNIDQYQPAHNFVHSFIHTYLVQRRSVTFKMSLVNDQIARIQGINDDTIVRAVFALSDDVIDSDSKSAACEVLMRRRDRLHEIVGEARRAPVPFGFV